MRPVLLLLALVFALGSLAPAVAEECLFVDPAIRQVSLVGLAGEEGPAVKEFRALLCRLLEWQVFQAV